MHLDQCGTKQYKSDDTEDGGRTKRWMGAGMLIERMTASNGWTLERRPGNNKRRRMEDDRKNCVLRLNDR